MIAESDTNRARGLHYFSPPDSSFDLQPSIQTPSSPSPGALDDLCGWHRDHGASAHGPARSDGQAY